MEVINGDDQGKEIKMTAQLSNGAEACKWQGVDYIALYVSPRGFANEFSIYIVPASNAAKVSILGAKLQKSVNRDVGEGYIARWLSPQEIAQHIHGSKDAATGDHCVLTVDDDGNKDVMWL